MILEDIYPAVEDLIRSTGEYIRNERRNFFESKAEEKAFNNLVTTVDKGAEERLVAGLQGIFPEAGFIAEEGTGERAADWNWIIDPIDGTTNFVHGVPCYSISVALSKHHEVVMGFVYELNLDEMFGALKGKGATLNGQRITVSATSELRSSLLATGFPYDDFGRMQGFLKTLTHFMKTTRGLRRMGSAAVDLAYVACGRFDAFFEYALNPWDVAAGYFIVQEAGGLVSDFQGGLNYTEGEEIVASNGKLHRDLIGVTRKSF